MEELEIKILLIGDINVGKTSLISRFVDEKFKESYISTIGVEYKQKQILLDGRKVNLQIWDTSGQERFKALTKNFYQKGDCVIFVFDITEMKSFSNIKDWLINTESCIKHKKYLLVGNKSDLKTKNNYVREDVIKSFSKKHEMKFIETSAKDGKNVVKIFEEITRVVFQGLTEEEIKNNFSKSKPSNSKSVSTDKFKNKQKCC